MNRLCVVVALMVGGSEGCSRGARADGDRERLPALEAPRVVTRTPSTADAPRAVPSITIGQSVRGVLQPGDLVLSDEGGRLADDYQIELRAGHTITIVTVGGASVANAGSTLDVVTSLVCRGHQVARDDDGAGYPNSRIVFTPTQNTTCTVRVMGFAGDAGPYTLNVTAG